MRQLAASGYCRLFDVAATLSDENAATGTWLDATDTTDGTHPDSSGTLKLVPVAQTVFA